MSKKKSVLSAEKELRNKRGRGWCGGLDVVLLSDALVAVKKAREDEVCKCRKKFTILVKVTGDEIRKAGYNAKQETAKKIKERFWKIECSDRIKTSGGWEDLWTLKDVALSSLYHKAVDDILKEEK